MGYTVAGLRKGFVIAPFEETDMPATIEAASPLYLEDLDMVIGRIRKAYSPAFESDCLESDQGRHCTDVQSVINQLGEHEKCVLARRISHKGELNFAESFMSLAEAFPDAMIFCFHSPLSGTWIGATPELLLKYRTDRFETVALAGTRSAGTQSQWDIKNVEEQAIVTEYILDVFCEYGFSKDVMETAGPRTRVFGDIEHLITDINVKIPNRQPTSHEIIRILGMLAPTPALCGYPRKKALGIIATTEKFKRGYYGGYCGPVSENGECEIFVNLRSVRLSPGGWSMIVGGGITGASVPEKEWMETENKAETILRSICIKN